MLNDVKVKHQYPDFFISKCVWVLNTAESCFVKWHMPYGLQYSVADKKIGPKYSFSSRVRGKKDRKNTMNNISKR